MLHLISGERQSGKTKRVHAVLGKCAEKNEKAMLIVPKQYTFESDKSILRLLGPKSASEIEVLSFSRLVAYAMNECGFKEKKIAKGGMRAILMSLAIDGLKDKLKVFSRHKNDFALVKKMLSAVDEFKTSGVTAEDLASAAEIIQDKTLKLKIEETALIYSAYEAVASENHFDDADVLLKIAELSEKGDFFNGKTVAIDGFYEFTFGELRLIEVMLKKCKDLYITLPMPEEGDEYSLFSASFKTARKLKKLCGRDGIEADSEFMERKLPKEGLEFLKDNLFKRDFRVYEGEENNAEILISSDIYKECDAVARRIKKALREGKYRSRDFSVIFRESDSYERIMKTALKKYDIPFFEDRRQPVENQPLISLVKNLLSVSAEGFSSEAVLRLLKTGLMSFSESEIAEIENYVYIWDIDGKTWQREWNFNPRGFGAELGEREKEKLKILNSIREKAVAPILDLKEKLKEKNGKDITRLLYSFLRENGIDESLKNYALSLEESGLFDLALEQEQVWDILMESLDEIAGVLENRPISLKRYLEIFDLVISEKSLGKLPDGFDEVFLLSADRALTHKNKVVFVLGLNADIFPKTQRAEGLLSVKDKERMKELDLEIGESFKDFVLKERFLLYSSLFAAKERLILSYLNFSQKGESLKESDVIKDIRRILPNIKENNTTLEKTEELIESEKAAFEIMAKNWNENTIEEASLKAYFEGKEDYKNRLEAIKRATDGKNFKFKDEAKSLKLFGEKIELSASKIETYYKCPFMYFCKYGLLAKPREKARFDPANSGTVIHYCLETVLKKYKGREFLNLSDEELSNELKAALTDYLNREMGSKEDKTERFNYLYERTLKVLERILEALTAEFLESEFETCGFELKLGENCEIPVEPTELKIGSVQLSGSVDRVDKMDKDGKRYIRVVDYKSGAKEFSLGEVLYGINLQMLLYLVSITRSKDSFYKGSVPAGVLYFPARIPAVNISREATEEERTKKYYSALEMNGLLIGDEEIVSAMDKAKKGYFLPVSFSSKDGSLKGNLLTLAQFKKLGEYLDSLISSMGNNLHEGSVPARPIVFKNKSTPCDYCDYKDVCLREKGEYRFAENMSHDEAKEKIMGGEKVEQKLD